MNKRIATLIALVMAFCFITACRKEAVVLDFGDAASFESALNAGDNLEGKTVRFVADELHPNSAYGYNVWSGEHLNFVSPRNPDIKEGDVVDIRATEIISEGGSWFIKYEKVEGALVGENTVVSSDEDVVADEEVNGAIEDALSEINQSSEAEEEAEKEGMETSDAPAEEEPEPEVSKDQIEVKAELTQDNRIAVFITNNSDTIIDELDVQVEFLDASGLTIDMDSDGHDMVLPGYTVVSMIDTPSDEYADFKVDYNFSVGDHPHYENHSENVAIDANPGSDGVIVKVTNNADVTIDEIEFDVVLYKGDEVVNICYPEDVYDVAPGQTETVKVLAYDRQKLSSLVYDKDYDRIEVYLNQAHTFGF